MNTVYQVGIHPKSAINPHSFLAPGGIDLARINTVPKVEAHVLHGAVVGGPNSKDQYCDLRNDYDQSEPALDTVSPMISISSYFFFSGLQRRQPLLRELNRSTSYSVAVRRRPDRRCHRWHFHLCPRRLCHCSTPALVVRMEAEEDHQAQAAFLLSLVDVGWRFPADLFLWLGVRRPSSDVTPF